MGMGRIKTQKNPALYRYVREVQRWEKRRRLSYIHTQSHTHSLQISRMYIYAYIYDNTVLHYIQSYTTRTHAPSWSWARGRRHHPIHPPPQCRRLIYAFRRRVPPAFYVSSRPLLPVAMHPAAAARSRCWWWCGHHTRARTSWRMKRSHT
jgi:hypothetical protein